MRALYDGTDGLKWQPQIDTPTFKQKACTPDGQQVLMFNINVTIAATKESCTKLAMDFDHRQTWDKTLYDFRIFEQTPCDSYCRLSYAFKSPGPVSDRDFYLQQLFKRDFPEPTFDTLHVTSIVNDAEMPPIKNRVRASMIIIAFIFSERADPKTGLLVCDITMVNSCDINGYVPKWMVNMASKSVPQQWFKNFEQEAIKWEKEHNIN